MNIRVEPGLWVVAVSGGVDSIALLHMLHGYAQANPHTAKFIVAHFDHGIREDSHEDRKLVQQLAKLYNFPFVYEQANLGADASEAVARKARYDFLESVRDSSGAIGIITAHHHDDLLETSIHNLIRGTGRRGLTALRSNSAVQRPLLQVPKQRLKEYAKANGLVWREDVTNADTKYLRNYIRHNVLAKFPDSKRAELAILVADMHAINDEIDSIVAGMLHVQPHVDKLDRAWFIALPHDVAREVVYAWLRAHSVQDISRKMVERLIVYMKTAKPAQHFPVDKNWQLGISKNTLALKPTER